MVVSEKIVTPLSGKTFSLYGESKSSDTFYEKISTLADSFLSLNGNIKEVLQIIRYASKRRRGLKKISRKSDGEDVLSFIVHTLRDSLSEYTTPLKSHLKGLTIRQRFDRTISTIEEQYHLYMLEIELVNRLYKNSFSKAEIKLGFLPYCLHDIDKNCKAKTDGIDFVCQKCSRKCYINNVTSLLAKYDIKAYLWMEANLKSLFRKLKAQRRTIGVFGMACLPELVRGMELCMKLEVPVIGQPIDANRCRRWMGEYNQTTTNLKQLEKLISS
jgi:hypothetical protein